MQYVGHSKIGAIRSKPNVTYPMIRLPQKCSAVIGQRAEIYATDHNGQPALLVIPCEDDDCTRPEAKVSKLGLETDVEARLSGIEHEIRDLKLLILKNDRESAAKSKKQAPESGFEPESEPRQLSSGAKLPPARSARS